ncbi:MAG: cell division protein [Gammaproteobacteria bacterium]|nr:cell division protein [Gammaproteobacteria bacterium]
MQTGFRNGATQRSVGLRRLVRSWFVRHLQVFFSSLGQISRTPLGSLMTAGVIGIAMALPTGLYLLLNNVQTISSGWDGTAKISLFLKEEIDDTRAVSLVTRFRTLTTVESAHLITRAEALAEYREMSGFAEALQALDMNPLPAVIVIHPTPAHSSPLDIQRLVEEFRRHDEVDLAQFDLQWVKRLYAIMEIIKRGVVVLAVLFSLAVLLIVGNTIRLEIENRREEIEIAKLFGATDAFIRRPFLYTGLWYGMLGAFIAGLLVGTAFELLREPVRRLADLYSSNFLILSLDIQTTTVLLAAGGLLGLFGSWVAVGRHLGVIELS